MSQSLVLRDRLGMLFVSILAVITGLVIGFQGLESGASAARNTPAPSLTPGVPLSSHARAYSYDGWQTGYRMSGGYARLTVIPARGVIPGTQDFVAVRMLAKIPGLGGVGDRWLEVGYATSGMCNGQTLVYTFDTGSGEWHFYPQYPLRTNQQIEVGLFSGGDGAVWDAWLFYDGNWFTLATVAGPGQPTANFEYYVETHHAEGDSNHAHIWAPAYSQVIDDEIEPLRAR